MNVTRHAFAALLATYPPLAAPRPTDRGTVDVDDAPLLTADDLGLSAFDPIRSTIEHPAGDDGSKDALRCAGDMVRAGHGDDKIFGILFNEANPVSAHIFRQTDPRRAALRIIGKVRGDAAGEGAGELADRGATYSGGGAGAGARGPRSGAETQPLDLIDPASWEGQPLQPRAYVVHGLFLQNSVGMVTGKGAVGKSLLLQQAATAVALGALFLGMRTSQCNAGYLSAEDDARELQERQIAICEMLKVTLSDLHQRLVLGSLIDMAEKALVRAGRDERMVATALFESIRLTVLKYRLGMLVLDNVGHFFDGNEINRSQVVAFLGMLNKLALDTRCAIILIAHPNKSGSTYSGSTAWQNQVRVEAHLAKPENEPDSNVRELRLEKSNYTPPGPPIRIIWHRGAYLLEDDVPADDGTRTTAIQMRQNEIFYACLDSLTTQSRAASNSNNAANYAPKVFAKMPDSLRKGMTEAVFEQVMERLLGAGMIERGQLEFSRSGSRNKAEGLRRVERREDPDEAPF